jgi:hypothetical protein
MILSFPESHNSVTEESTVIIVNQDSHNSVTEESPVIIVEEKQAITTTYENKINNYI